MPGKKRTSGLLLYNKLLHELSQINQAQPEHKQLSLAARRKLLSEKIYPAYQDQPKSKFRITEARKDIERKVKRYKPQRAVSTKPSLYNRLLHELTTINDQQSADRRLTLAQRRELLSSVYPGIKGLPKSQLRMGEIREEFTKEVKRLTKKKRKKKRVVDITAVPEENYAEINYWEIDEFIKEKLGRLPGVVFAKVTTGNYGFGDTEIFDVKQYDYQQSGVKDITDAINEYVRSLPSRRRGMIYPYYTGLVQLKPGKPNNEKPENYYLEFILVIRNLPAKELIPVKIAKRKGKKQKKKVQKLDEFFKKRTKKLVTQKSRIKRIRISVTKEISDYKNLAKKKFIPEKEIKDIGRRGYLFMKNKLDKYLKDDVITQRQYDSLLAQIKKGYGQE